jgi:hypothetical protein
VLRFCILNTYHGNACAVRFYDGTVKIGMMEAFKKLAVGPDALPDIIFASIGRTIWKVCTAAAAAY